MKNTMRVKPSSATRAIYAEFGRFSLIIKQKCQMIKYWKRVKEMRNNYMSRKHIIPHLNYMILAQTNWCTYLKGILNETSTSLCKIKVWITDNVLC